MSAETDVVNSPNLIKTAILLAVLCSVLFQGSRGLYESTEGRYVQCARETLNSGQLLEPMLNGDHHWTKPPLTYAAIAAGLVTLGNNTWGARAYLSLAFIITVLCVYLAGRCLWGERAAGLAALIYATSPFTVGAANAVSTDTLLVCFQALATACFWLAVTRNHKGYMLGMWVALGLAALAKGPAGFVPLAGIFPAYVALRWNKTPVPPFLSIPGILLFSLVGMSWYALEIFRHPFLLNYWVMHETVGRFAENEFQRNPELSKMFTVYPPILLLGTGPWILLLALKQKHVGLSRETLTQWRPGPNQAHWCYFVGGILLPFAFFSVSTSRLALYILPLFVPMILLMGKGMDTLVESRKVTTKTLVGMAYALMLLLVVAKGVSGHLANNKDMKQLADQIRPAVEAHAAQNLVIFGKAPLNGLEFYLGRSIPTLDYEKSTGTTENAKPESPILPANTLVLGRTKVMKPLAENLLQGHHEILFQNKYWTLASVDQPVNIPELREKVQGFKTKLPVVAPE